MKTTASASSAAVHDQSRLSALRLYKYAAVDKSPLSYYVLTPYWNYATTLFPLWMAPNLITLTGLGFILINVATIEYYMPDLVGPAPAWVYYSLAAGLFLYQTFDNVDGKQARRTGSSSPLGELFDHGIDSLNCTLGGIVMCAALAFGSTFKGAVVIVISSWPMFFSSWEQFHTGILYLGFFNGPTEGIIIACACMLLSAIFGPQIWHVPAVNVFGEKSRWLLENMGMDDLFMANIIFALFFVHIPFCLFNVHVARSKKGLSTVSTFAEWLPILLFTGSASAWILSPYSCILPDNHLVLFAFFLCLIFGRMTTKIILAHLLKQPFPMFTVMLLPLMGGAMLVNAPRFGLNIMLDSTQELWMIWTFLALAFIMYTRWALHVIGEFTAYLGINCLTIPSADSKSSSRK